jgi:hypothetical protein
MVVPERRLHRVKLVVPGKPLDGCYVRAIGLTDKHGAGFYGAAVNMYGARAALAGVAPNVGTRKPEVISEEMNQQRPIFNVGGHRFAVDRQADFSGHYSHPPFIRPIVY